MQNRSMPDNTVIPVLAYADLREVVAWLCRTFGFRERLRIAGHRAQLAYGDGVVVATDRGGQPSGHSVMVRVPDADAHHAHSLACGATILHPPTTYPFGERQYTARDPGGHVWTFSQTVADVDPAEWGGVVG